MPLDQFALAAPVDRDDTPSLVETVDLRQRQRIDHKAQRRVGRKIECDGEHCADRAGVHDQHDIARRQCRKAVGGAADLIDETFAARRTIARRRFPEIAVGIAEFGDEIIVTPSRPRSKILLFKGFVPDRRLKPKGCRGLPGSPCRAANFASFRRQTRFKRG